MLIVDSFSFIDFNVDLSVNLITLSPSQRLYEPEALFILKI